jgi:hypothetical protein
MTPRTLRRKLQKKATHKKYRKCPACGGRSTCRVCKQDGFRWKLIQRCRCGHVGELTWSGGGTADTYPTGPTRQGKGPRGGCAGSSPAPTVLSDDDLEAVAAGAGKRAVIDAIIWVMPAKFNRLRVW